MEATAKVTAEPHPPSSPALYTDVSNGIHREPIHVSHSKPSDSILLDRRKSNQAVAPPPQRHFTTPSESNRPLHLPLHKHIHIPTASTPTGFHTNAATLSPQSTTSHQLPSVPEEGCREEESSVEPITPFSESDSSVTNFSSPLSISSTEPDIFISVSPSGQNLPKTTPHPGYAKHSNRHHSLPQSSQGANHYHILVQLQRSQSLPTDYPGPSPHLVDPQNLIETGTSRLLFM